MDWFGGLSDAVLALVGLGLGLHLLQRGGDSAGTGGVGLLLVGLAAGFGSFRLTVAPELGFAHDGLTRMAGMVGQPLIGVAFATAVVAPQHARQARSITFVTMLVASVLLIAVPEWRLVSAGGAMICAAAFGLASRQPVVAACAVLGAALTVAAGLVVGTTGTWLGASRLGWFHVVLVVSHTLLAVGLLRLDPGPANDAPSG